MYSGLLDLIVEIILLIKIVFLSLHNKKNKPVTQKIKKWKKGRDGEKAKKQDGIPM